MLTKDPALIGQAVSAFIVIIFELAADAICKLQCARIKEQSEVSRLDETLVWQGTFQDLNRNTVDAKFVTQGTYLWYLAEIALSHVEVIKDTFQMGQISSRHTDFDANDNSCVATTQVSNLQQWSQKAKQSKSWNSTCAVQHR